MDDIGGEVRARFIALYEAKIFGLLHGATIDNDWLLATLAGHLAEHDDDELLQILRGQRERRRFA
jgi:hypothetical protein